MVDGEGQARVVRIQAAVGVPGAGSAAAVLDRHEALAAIPRPGGAPVTAEPIAPHRLALLDHEAGKFSGGRGFARRVDGGAYNVVEGTLSGDGPATRFAVSLAGTTLVGALVIEQVGAEWIVRLAPATPSRNR